MFSNPQALTLPSIIPVDLADYAAAAAADDVGVGHDHLVLDTAGLTRGRLRLQH